MHTDRKLRHEFTNRHIILGFPAASSSTLTAEDTSILRLAVTVTGNTRSSFMATPTASTDPSRAHQSSASTDPDT